MPLFAIWKRNSAVWLMPLAGLIVGLTNNEQLIYADGYTPFLASQKTSSLIMLGMIAAGTGAFEGAWLRHSRVLYLPGSRPFISRITPLVLMTWLPTATLLMASVVAVGGIAAWQVWSTALLSLLAWVCVGFGIGVAFRPAISIPLAVIAAFGWFAFTPSIEPPWIRHLAGRWHSCCMQSMVPDVRVIVGVCLMAVALVVASFIIIHVIAFPGSPLRFTRSALAGFIVLGAFAASGVVAQDADYSAAQFRTDSLLCVGEKPVLCFWPERATYLHEAEQQIRSILSRWQEKGIEIPQKLSESALRQEDVGVLFYAHNVSEDHVISLSEGLAQWCSLEAAESYKGLPPYQVRDWLIHEINPASTIIDRDGLSQFLKEPMDHQIRQINDALRNARRCP